jgi:hypothetical protein
MNSPDKMEKGLGSLSFLCQAIDFLHRGELKKNAREKRIMLYRLVVI